ncbi:hypothetical protein PR048_032214 [Dryococelus australis]|uniref:DDE Tnp4 domain-containing protein n=1 Tax=Dryococelus australis TaxID=614101 RepID=A0ABQ9G5Q6_9NEOP|nr:hypothetical protein PR048_032214 [Dryococelus australis]
MAAMLLPRNIEFFNVVNEIFEEGHQNGEEPRPRRCLRDTANPLEFYSVREFRQKYRFSKENARWSLLPMILIEGQNRRGLPLIPMQQLLQKNMQNWIKFPAGSVEFARNRLRLYEIGHFPGAIGAVDGTHIRIESPGGERAEVYTNRKCYFSVTVQEVVGVDMQIMGIACRWPGSTHDSRTFSNSGVKLMFEDGRLQGILFGDSRYPQLQYMFTPVLKHAVHTNAERRFQ